MASGTSGAMKLTYTCVNDLVLKAKIDFTGKEPRSIYERLSAMRQKSDQAKKRGDFETAYIMLKRWLDSVEWLRRTHVKNGKSVYAASMTVDQVGDDVSKIRQSDRTDDGIHVCIFF